MKSFIAFLEKYFVPVAARIGAQKHLVAIRDGFVVTIPLLIAGSFATLINNLPIDAYQNMMVSTFGEGWTNFGGNIWNGTFAILSLVVAFTIAYNLAKSYDVDGLSAGIISFASLMTITQSAAEAWAIPYAWTGGQGLFISIFVSLIATEIFVTFMKRYKLVLKMPEGVPPAVAKSFAALFPGLITLAIFAFVKIGFATFGIINIHEWFFGIFVQPLIGLANTFTAAIIIVLVNHLLWFFGLHGSNILDPVMQSLYIPPLEANAAGIAQNIVTKPFFDAFVYLGGSGVTICLLIAIFIASKRKQNRTIAGLGIAPGFFNINEPVMFGLPIVLNPVFFIPFMLVPIVLTIISYLAIGSGLVPVTTVLVPWTTPPIIGGFLATGGAWQGAVLAAVNMVVGILMYIPFIMISEKMEAEKEKES